MDSGALGIIVPMVSDYHSVLAATNSMHYPPRGNRGVGLARAQSWGRKFIEYKDEIEEQTLLIAQIEHIDAVKNIDNIFGSGLIDAYIIGPYDLSASLGSPGNFEKTEFISALEKIKESAKKYKIPSGFHLVEPDKNRLKELIKEGYSFIAYSVDTVILREAGNIDVK
jgi:2-dehydro-3-deoxyglucarate aldolase